MSDNKLSNTLRMLIDRMWEHPEEFVHPNWDPVQFGAWEKEPFEDVRWGNVIRACVTSGKDILFDEEEIETIMLNYKEILRKQIDACIVKELVGGTRENEIKFQEKQMELPYVSQSTALTSTQKQRAKEIAEMFKTQKGTE